MRKSYVKKSLVIGAICLLMLVSFPIVNSLIEYPREKGPYNVFMGGKCSCGGNKPLWFDFPGLLKNGKPRWLQLGPLSLHRWPVGPQYKMEKSSILIVNGKIQNIEYPVSMMLKGFKGYAPSIYYCYMKTLISSRIRVFGVCEEIDLYN
jgi:hypothetical protein